MRKIVLVGSGNMAEALAVALTQNRVGEVQLLARNRERAKAIAEFCPVKLRFSPAELEPADFYLIAVVDRAVAEVAEALSVPSGAVVAHTAGSVGIEALPEKFPHRGSFYPFQTLTKGRRVDFAQIPVFLEASDDESLALLKELAGRISRRIYEADSERRRLIHLAGVFANNFANAMYTLGERVAERAGLSFDVLRALITETALKAAEARHPCEVQTGPAVRGDEGVQQAHLKLLEGDEEMQRIYQLISKTIWETSRKTS